MGLRQFQRPVLELLNLFLPARRFYSQYSVRRNPYLNYKVMSAKDTIDTRTSTATIQVEIPKKKLFKPLVWIDCEMTGLDHTKDQIIEICCIVTDGHLNIVEDNCYESTVHCDEQKMGQMNEWCIEHHGKSGLTKRVIDSDKTKEQVENELLQFIKNLIPEPNVGVLAGNTVHMDRLFMLKDFPKVIDHLFYRIVDVSSLMEVSFRHNPALAGVAPKKDKNHTAKSDILESIEQLKWYTNHYLKNPQETQEFVENQQPKVEQPQDVSNTQATTQTTAEKHALELQGEPLLKSRKL